MTNDQARRQFNAKLTNKACQGGAFAIGVAAVEILGAIAAPAASAAVAAVETAVVVPTVLTVAAVGGCAYGTYAIIKHVSDSQ